MPRVSAAEASATLADLRTKALAQRALAVCAVWPKGVAAADATDAGQERRAGADSFRRPRSGHAPANGAEVAKTLPASRHIVARGYGHIVSPHACAPRLIAAFIDDPTFATLPASCVEHFEKSRRPPLWPDRLGART